jgi:hypothetical protein
MVKVEIPQEEQERVERLPYNLPSKLKPILDFYKFCVANKDTSVVIVVDGKSGLGKSTLGGQVGLYCDKNFNIESYCFTPEEFLKKLETAKKGSCLIFDEGMLLSSRSALSEINKMTIIAMSMIRSKQLFIIFCVNSIFDLDRNLALSRADILLSLYGAHLVDRGKFLAFFKAEDGVDRLKQLYLMGKKYYSYTSPKSNFNTTFPKHFVVDMDEYERRKQEGVAKFLSSSRGKLGNKAIESRNKVIRWMRENTNLSFDKIGEIAGVSNATVFNIMKEAADQK